MSKLKMPPNCIDVGAQYHGTVTTLVGAEAFRKQIAASNSARRVAVHEAGHSVLARCLLGPACCGGATIIPDGNGLDGHATVAGHHTIHNDFIARGEYRDFLSSVFLKLQVCLAGPEAERIAFGDCDARGDMRMIKQLCERYSISDDDVERLRPQVHALLTKHWDAVERVAAALLDKKTLTGVEIDALVHDNVMDHS